MTKHWGIDRVGLAPPTPVAAVWLVHLDYGDALARRAISANEPPP